MWRSAPTTHDLGSTLSGDEEARRPSPRSMQISTPGSTPPLGTLSAPDLRGMDATGARLIGRLSELRIQVDAHPTEEALWGRVVAQDPAPGDTLVPGDTVTITVGARPTVLVPDVRGGDETEMLAVLRDTGLRPERRVTRRSSSMPEGHIVRTRPRAGSLVPQGTRVTYVVATPRSPHGRGAKRHQKRTRSSRLPEASFLSLPSDG